MNTLAVNAVEFSGIINPWAVERIHEHLKPFSYEFSLGRSYLLNAEIGQGGWALSWIIAGVHVPMNGTILRDGVLFECADRQKEVWCVRRSEIKKFGIFSQTLEAQIRQGLRTVHDQYLQTEAEIMERFYLTPERYKRPLRQFSHEGWRASCAIGLVHGKKVFCFPHMPDEFLKTFRLLWFENMLNLLRDSGALVILPARLSDLNEGLCDEVVTLP